MFSKGSNWITFSSSSPLSRLLIWVSFFVLISGKSDWLNDFCDLFMYERISSTQFFYCTSPGGQKLRSIFEVLIGCFHPWSFRASQNDQFGNVVWMKARKWFFFFVPFSWIDETIKTFFCTSVSLVRFFWLASLKCQIIIFIRNPFDFLKKIELNRIWFKFTIVSSAPLGDFVLINGQSDWLNSFVTYSCMKDSHQLIFLHFTWWAKTDCFHPVSIPRSQNDRIENL